MKLRNIENISETNYTKAIRTNRRVLLWYDFNSASSLSQSNLEGEANLHSYIEEDQTSQSYPNFINFVFFIFSFWLIKILQKLPSKF